MKRCSICGGPARLYPAGWRCPAHTPAASFRRSEPPDPDPARSLDGMRRAAGIVWTFRASDAALNDDRAVASGRRRSSPTRYRAARAAEEARKGKT